MGQNLDAVGFFTSFDKATLSTPQAVITTPMTAQALAPAVQLAMNMGFTTQNAQTLAAALSKYQSGLTQSGITSFAKSGSRSFFVNIGSALEDTDSGDPVMPVPAPVGGSGLNPQHSWDCNAFFAAGVIAALTGNELAGAICAIYCWSNC